MPQRDDLRLRRGPAGVEEDRGRVVRDIEGRQRLRRPRHGQEVVETEDLITAGDLVAVALLHDDQRASEVGDQLREHLVAEPVVDRHERDARTDRGEEHLRVARAVPAQVDHLGRVTLGDDRRPAASGGDDVGMGEPGLAATESDSITEPGFDHVQQEPDAHDSSQST